MSLSVVLELPGGGEPCELHDEEVDDLAARLAGRLGVNKNRIRLYVLTEAGEGQCGCAGGVCPIGGHQEAPSEGRPSNAPPAGEAAPAPPRKKYLRQGRGTVAEQVLTFGTTDDGSPLKLHVSVLCRQFSYRGVFVLEYLGPLLIWLAIFGVYMALRVPKPTPDARYPLPPMGKLVPTVMWTFHYVKRLLETFFVHKFSNPTMPLRNLFKNCIYYWSFAALVAYSVLFDFGPLTHRGTSHLDLWVGLAGFTVCECLNLYCHVYLANLRPPGVTAHLLPKGFLFDRITCPNYTMEILSWMFFNIATQTWAGLAFNVCGMLQMVQWAKKKKERLVEEFPEAAGRGLLLPGLQPSHSSSRPEEKGKAE